MQTRQSQVLVAFLLLLVASATANAQPADGEVRVPFPNVAPRPSAVTLYCQPALTSTLAGNEEWGTDPAHIGAKTYKASTRKYTNGDDGWIKVSFDGPQLVLQSRALPLATPEERHEGYGRGLAYRVVNDDPGNFLAVRDSGKGIGNLAVIALNRETGTLMLTSIWASLSDKRHPSTSATFFMCGATPQ